jgi:septal ring factor EnvC (AmiA/AmiB activator)
MPPDRENRLGETNWEEFEFKLGSRDAPLHTRSTRRQPRQSRIGSETSFEGIAHRSRTPGEEKKATEMAANSGSKPTTEDRLNALEGTLENLKQMLNHQLDFLQNLDIDAGRRLEMLEGDITTMKFELTEELGKLRKELKDPKQEFEARVSQLEEKMAQLNKDWKQDPK